MEHSAADAEYKFVRIQDAITSLNQRINLSGVVVESSLPKTTRGADLFRALRIIDESQPTTGFYVHFFGETVDELPHAHTVGDIVVVSRAVVQQHDSDSYALFLSRTSSFALFKGRGCSGNEPMPYQTSRNYNSRDQDKKSVMELRNWWTHNKIEDLIGLSLSTTFEHIKKAESVDVICKILHISEVEGEWVLYLWDGTDTPPAAVEAKLEDEMDNPLPLQLEPSLLSSDILCTFPPVGTVLKMFVDKGVENFGMKSLSSNRWVKFLHIKCEIRAAMWCAVLMSFTKLFYLPDDADCVMERQRSFDKRMRSKWGRVPISFVSGQSHITETDHPDVAFMTLMDVVTHPKFCTQHLIYKFKCVVRVVAILPWKPEQFRSPRGVYRMRLTLEDPTARIHAYLYAEDGEKFFGNLCSFDLLTKKRNMLLGIADGDNTPAGTDVTRNPPWIQCLLKSYCTDESNRWRSTTYRIFDTTMVG